MGPDGGFERDQVQRRLLVARCAVTAGDEADRIVAERPPQTRAIQRRRLIAQQQQADRTALPFDDGVGRQRGRERDEADIVDGQLAQDCLHRTAQADGKVVFRRECLGGGRNSAADGIEQDGIGVRPTGVETQEVQETAYAEREARAARN